MITCIRALLFPPSACSGFLNVVLSRQHLVIWVLQRGGRYSAMQLWAGSMFSWTFRENLMYNGPCIIVIVEDKETNLMSQLVRFYFTSSMLNIFRTSIYPSSGACDFLLYHHIGCVFFFPTHIEKRTHNQCVDTIENRRLLMMDILMSETCWA